MIGDGNGRVVVVTGGGTGLGRELATGYAARGSQVAVAEFDAEGCDSVRRRLTAIGGDHLVAQVDVRDPGSVAAFFSEVGDRYGRLDLLINNAGIVPHFNWGNPRWPQVADMPFEQWSLVISTNLHGAFLCAKHAIPLLRKAGGGHILNVHGGSGRPKPGHLAYSVSKAATATLSRHLAEELREQNICVVSVDPGGAFATERAPAAVQLAQPGPARAAEHLFAAAGAPMDLSGNLLTLTDGHLSVLS